MNEKYQKIIGDCEKILEEHWQEQVTKFNEYVNEVQKNKSGYQKLRYRLPNAIIPCIPIRDAMNPNISFNFRYLDSKIAEITGMDENYNPKLFFKNCAESLEKYGFDMKLITDLEKEYSWHDPVSTSFRRHFKGQVKRDIENDTHFNKEATIQTALWKLLKNSKKEKGNLCNIQPVCMFNRFFEPPAFLSAANVTTQGVFSSKNPGNIDMISRIGTGKNSELAVIELKKEEATKPDKAILQAIVYAVCVKKLLFCNELGNKTDKWWKLYGYGQKVQGDFTVPKNFVMHAVVCMPYYDEIDKSFALTEPLCLGDGVKLYLDYLYFDINDRNRISFRRENVSIQKIKVL